MQTYLLHTNISTIKLYNFDLKTQFLNCFLRTSYTTTDCVSWYSFEKQLIIDIKCLQIFMHFNQVSSVIFTAEIIRNKYMLRTFTLIKII